MDKDKKKRYRKMIRKRAGPKLQESGQTKSGRQGSVRGNSNVYTPESTHNIGSGVSRSSINTESIDKNSHDALNDRLTHRTESMKHRLPTKSDYQLVKVYDRKTGEYTYKLQKGFKYEKPGAGNRIKDIGRIAEDAGLHRSFSDSTDENDSNPASDVIETGFSAGNVTDHMFQSAKTRRQQHLYRKVNKLQEKQFQSDAEQAYKRFIADNPEIQGKELNKRIQRQRIKRQYARRYAKEYRRKYLRERIRPGMHAEAEKVAGIARRLKEELSRHRSIVIGAAGVMGLFIIIMATLASCGAIFTEGLSTVVGSSYQSKPQEIDSADLVMTQLEMELQDEIDAIESTYPGYDEYEYNLDGIGHDPISLISYLSAKYTDFTAPQVNAEIEDIFDQMYDLSTSEREETRTRTVTKTGTRETIDPNTGNTIEEEYEYEEEEEYTVRILSVTLKSKSIEEAAVSNLPSEDKDLYDTYTGTKGLLQYYYSPLALDWQSYIKSYYGYRKNPIIGNLEFHKGVDIAVPEGTEVYASQTGTVTQAAYDTHYGNFIVIENDKGYVSKYAHLSDVTVTAGQEIKHGELIGHTGHTGSSTGSELHIECLYNGDYYNPVFYFENGEGSLYPVDEATGELIPIEATGDAAALIAEAEKYLGYPYVWGGSSPSTSFDCSGFVSWCLNASGYADVGRQTAQGLSDISHRVSQSEAQPGDLIFFTGTYKSGTPVSHVGIYLGNGQMIHAGDPIKITNINTAYWQSHFYSYGRI